ncbi:MAG: hypothetical protein KAT65_11595 [Methanophagales archaeon]|nr:hypothetical protein [Methanophagales archaeon]
MPRSALIQRFKKTFLTGLIFIASLVLSTIAILLPWRAHIAYLRILEFTSKIILRSNFVMDFVNEHAFAQESEKELLLRKEEKKE